MTGESFAQADPVQRRLRRLGLPERVDEARAFLRTFAHETGMDRATSGQREAAVVRALRRDGHYSHTPEELAFGARLAWRNNARCIGRLWWKSLEVVDCRHVDDPAAVAAHALSHMEEVWNGGRIRSRVTVFAPARPGFTPTTIESPQIIQYAGYLQPDGTVIGDRQNLELTRRIVSLGWAPPERQGRFDRLPLLVRAPDGRQQLFPVPDSAAREVAIRHPQQPGLGALGLRWYAVPCISNFVLTIGGIDYPCAPFNGHYMVTEIASRDLTDRWRYDLLPDIARALDLPWSAEQDPLWKDRALTEINQAVLHSFAADRTDIVDHHTASDQFMTFFQHEQREGRSVSADWTWIVPPQAASGCPVFYLPMEDRQRVPNFYYSRAVDGGALRADWQNERRGRWRQRYERMRRRWWDWRRQRARLLRL